MREPCYDCFRPIELCLCPELPRVANRTSVIVLQHVRERFHPFGSARMLTSALERAQLEVVYRGFGKSVPHRMQLPPGTGLLYPRPDARDLRELGADDKPEHMVLLDGTWSQAHRLYRDNPFLHQLPHYRISPKRQSRYLVRREPKAHCVSTLEAAIEALQILEPGLPGADELLALFEKMNVEQVKVRNASTPRPRTKRTRNRPSRALPPELVTGGAGLVMVYCESAEMVARKDPRVPEVLQWSAVRVATGQVATWFVEPAKGIVSEAHRARLGLTGEPLGAMIPPAQFQLSLAAWLRPDDVLVAWNSGTFAMTPAAVRRTHTTVQLKQCYCNVRGGKCGTLEEVVVREGGQPVQVSAPGRAGVRLANAVSILDCLLRER